MGSTEDRWRTWPDGEAGKQLVHIVVASSVDSLCRTLFGSASSFVVGLSLAQPIPAESRCRYRCPRYPRPCFCRWSVPPSALKGFAFAQLESHDVRGNKGYVETAWLGSEAEAEAATLPAASPKPAAPDAQQKLPAKGQTRRVAFNSVGMGMKVLAPSFAASRQCLQVSTRVSIFIYRTLPSCQF